MEGSLLKKNGLYSLPLHQQSKLKWSLHILYSFIIIMFIGFIMIPGNDQQKLILNILFLAFSIFFGYIWLGLALFNKPYLKITNESLEYKWLFGRKVILMNDIYRVECFSESGVNKLGIWASERGNRSFLEIINRILGRDYSVSIVMSNFQNIDFEKLRLTILSKINSAHNLP